MKKSFFALASALIFTLVTIVACSDDDSDTMPGDGNDGDDIVDPSFNRGELLEDLASNLILPNFESLQASVSAMSVATDNFVENTTEENLVALRSAWIQAVTDHQHCSAFGFGPASLNLGPYASVLGVFPVDQAQVETNIIDSDFNLAASFDRDVRGFYAVEYLIYGVGNSDAQLVAFFDNARKDYLQLIVNELKTTFDDIVGEWQASYLQEFINDDGTSAGSSISLLYNEFVQDYENLKNFKVELPAGLTAGQVEADPTLVEAFYSGISRDLIEEHFESSKNIWSGTTRNGQDIIGFDDYLNSVVGGPELVATTEIALASIDGAIGNLPEGRLSDQIDASEVTVLRDELQSNTANFKSSMSSLLGISITFNSGDGD